MKRKFGNITSILIITASALIVLLIVCAVFLLSDLYISEDRIERVIDHGTVMRGVSISGIDISGMTKDEAALATDKLGDSVLKDLQFTIDIDGETLRLLPEELGVDTNYEDVIEHALSYGHTGSFDDRKQAAETPKDFCVTVRAKEENVKTGLELLKQKWDKKAKDATYEFMADGYLSDGTRYNPENYDEKTQGEPKLVKISQDEQVIKFRYQYYNHNKYVEDYKPIQADISRFLYAKEGKGINIDVDDLKKKVISAVEDNDYSAIIASVQASEPSIKITEIKNQTQLICSWTSSYKKHNGSNRIYNVTKLSVIINGKIIKPGETWSINEETGPRTLKSGWKPATGLSGGEEHNNQGEAFARYQALYITRHLEQILKLLKRIVIQLSLIIYLLVLTLR